MAEASTQAVCSPPPRQSARVAFSLGNSKKAVRAATPWAKNDAPEEYDASAEDQAVLDVAKTTGAHLTTSPSLEVF